MKAKLRLAKNIQSVQLLIGRIVATTPSGKQHSYRYEQLTPKQESKLRSMAAPTAKRQEIKTTHRTGKPKKSVNYAESILWTRNGLTEVL